MQPCGDGEHNEFGKIGQFKLFKILPNPRTLFLNVYLEDHGQIIHFALGCSQNQTSFIP